MKSTIRVCNKCNYRTLISDDHKEERKCKYCNGLLKIVLSESCFEEVSGVEE